nr:lipoprotein [Candidatus Tokpelaia sp.]
MIIGAAAVAGCGRRGAPELPPSAYMQNEKGQMVKKPQPDKPFILDKLIK